MDGNAFEACALFIFNDPATTEIYPLSLHDALPIFRAATISSRNSPYWPSEASRPSRSRCTSRSRTSPREPATQDRKSTRLNSSHANISYAVFCLKKKTKYINMTYMPQYHYLMINVR